MPVLYEKTVAFDVHKASHILSDVLEYTGRKILNLRARDKLNVCPSPLAIADIVTDGDRYAEAMIAESIRTRFPTHGIRGEQGTAKAGLEWEWVIDGIGGTMHYARGGSQFGMSVGLLREGVPVMGLIYYPAEGKLLRAAKDEGAFLNDRPLCMERTVKLQDAMVGFDFAPDGDREAQVKRYYAPLLRTSRYPLVTGSVAQAVLQIAECLIDAYVHPGATMYDVAAASVIMSEAGCGVNVGKRIEREHRSPFLVSSGERLHVEMAGLLGV